jgi:hypothetical protein
VEGKDSGDESDNHHRSKSSKVGPRNVSYGQNRESDRRQSISFVSEAKSMHIGKQQHLQDIKFDNRMHQQSHDLYRPLNVHQDPFFPLGSRHTSTDLTNMLKKNLSPEPDNNTDMRARQQSFHNFPTTNRLSHD